MLRMLIACWIPKAKYSQSEYVILTACPLQPWLQESSSLLHYTYISCLFRINVLVLDRLFKDLFLNVLLYNGTNSVK